MERTSVARVNRFSLNRMEIVSLVTLGLATAAVAALQSGRNSLSVFIGGVIGLANLRLWRSIVGGLLSGRRVSRQGLVGRFFLKILLLSGFILAVLKSPLSPCGVMGGFAAVLIGMVWAALFPGAQVE